MKIFNAKVIFLVLLIDILTGARVLAGGSQLEIGNKKLTLQMHTKCPQLRPSAKELAKYLELYDPHEEQGLTVYCEDRIFSKKDVKEIRDLLVQEGFRYPNGNESTITWMDFDGDGICDFTASAGIGGMKSIDRMFLFRGLANGKFQLIDSDLSYMDSSIALVPYIPIAVSGERLPILANPSSSELMQWQSDRKQFSTCQRLSASQKIEKPRSEPENALIALCPHVHEIVNWANKQLPQENKSPH